MKSDPPAAAAVSVPAPAVSSKGISSKNLSQKQVSFRKEAAEAEQEQEAGSVDSGEGIDDAASYQGSESDEELNAHELVGHDSNRR
jgi:hypothetical protein